MSVTYSKEAREFAKKNKMALFAADIDGRTSDDGVTGRYTCDGPCDCATARALWLFCAELSRGDEGKRLTPKQAFDKFFPGGNPAPIPARRKAKAAQ